VERKRHIGNDIVVIIYIESDDDEYPLGAALTFDPSCIKSKFNRIQRCLYILCSYAVVNSSPHYVFDPFENLLRIYPMLKDPEKGKYESNLKMDCLTLLLSHSFCLL